MRAVDELERGRDAYARRAWLDAYESLALSLARDDGRLAGAPVAVTVAPVGEHDDNR